MQNRSAAILAAILLLLPLHSSGQKLVNSPIARYNLGIIEPAGSFRSLGMGGTAIAMRDNLTLFHTNPASYSSLDTNSFIFDFGMDYGMNIISDGSNTDLSEDLNFDHLIIGFPIMKRWGFAAGLVPVTNGYYHISESVKKGDPGYDEIAGEYISFHNGSGGLTNFFVGTGLNITKNLSVGANMSLLFGSIKRYNEFDFADYSYTFQTNVTEVTKYSGIGMDFGLQYSADLKNNYFLNLGASYSTGRNCKTSFEKIAYRFNVYSPADTIEYSSDDSTRSHIPGTFRAGVAFGKKNKYTVGIDYLYSFWKDAEFPGSEGYVANTQTLILGAEYTPDRLSNYNFLKRVDYRLGVHIGNNYLLFNGDKINETGVSIGFGVPIKRKYSSLPSFYSKINFFADFTRKSVTGQSFKHNENYFTFGLSLNLFDNWFLKRKYD